MVLTADIGVAMVVMDRDDYINKSNKILTQPAYRAIPRDPTNKIKAKLINLLKRVQNQTGLDNNTYMAMYPMGCGVSSCGLVTYGVVKELTKILKPLVGKSPNHINITQDVVE